MCDADKWQKTMAVEMEQSRFIKVYGQQAASIRCVSIWGEIHYLLEIIFFSPSYPRSPRLAS